MEYSKMIPRKKHYSSSYKTAMVCHSLCFNDKNMLDVRLKLKHQMNRLAT